MYLFLFTSLPFNGHCQTRPMDMYLVVINNNWIVDSSTHSMHTRDEYIWWACIGIIIQHQYVLAHHSHWPITHSTSTTTWHIALHNTIVAHIHNRTNSRKVKTSRQLRASSILYCGDGFPTSKELRLAVRTNVQIGQSVFFLCMDQFRNLQMLDMTMYYCTRKCPKVYPFLSIAFEKS